MADYLFIDMHLHSIFSDEDLCDETPAHILSKVQGYCDKYNKANNTNVNCVVSISDHNTVLGCVEARKLIKSGKFPNVKLINGAEFTVDLCELNKKLGVSGAFTRCHLHGYDYNINNKELIAYSRITHKHFSNEDNIGLQICAARRAICEAYDINIPFVTYESMASLGQDANYVSEFLELTKKYFYKIGKEFNVEEIYAFIKDYLVDAKTYVPEATHAGRLKLSEAMTLIKNAGGKAVLAHPAYLNISLNGIKQLAGRLGYNSEDIMKNIKKNAAKNDRIDLSKLGGDMSKLVLEGFFELAKSLDAKYAFDGMETYYGRNFAKRNDLVIHEICKEKDLYETAGSDYHGENFASHKTIGNAFKQFIQREYGKRNHRTQERGLFVRVSSLPLVNLVVDGEIAENKQETKFIDEHFNAISFDELNKFITTCMDSPSFDLKQSIATITPEPVKFPVEVNKKIKSGIKALVTIASMLNPLLDKESTYKQRRKDILTLEWYCQSSYLSIKNAQEEFREHSELFGTEEHKAITKYLKEIHRKYYEMVRLDKSIVYDLKKLLKKQYSLEDCCIEKIATITIQEERDISK